MYLFRRLFKTRFLFALVCVPLLLLAACGSSGSTTSSTSSNPNSKITLTIGGKLDTEGILLTNLYSLALKDAGFTINEKDAFGNNTLVFSGIKSGALDIYPEFTATGLSAINKTSTFNDNEDFQEVKTAWKQQFNIDWLDYAPLNDTYAICMDKTTAQKDGISTISDLAAKASQISFDLPSDSQYVLDFLKKPYNLTQQSFKSFNKVDYAIGFKAVSSGQAQANFCYSTDLGITQNNLVVLTDNNHAFPAYHPAPVVRDAVLAKSPDIATVLNKLAPKLTTEVSLQLQQDVATNQTQGMSKARAITEAAYNFLKSNGFCSQNNCGQS